MNKLNQRFRDEYRVESDRLQDWDYSDSAWYHVTICTKNKEPFFGEIVEEEMRLSPLGMIVEEEWKRTEHLRPNVSLDEFTIMPNHFHAILQIASDHHMKTESVETPRWGVSATELRQWKPGTLGAIINQFKGICTKRIRSIDHPEFAWQRGYYDHIIRDDGDLRRIRRHIRLNPVKWSLDPYHLPV
jgi:REP element-mobilizing transposase RayT